MYFLRHFFENFTRVLKDFTRALLGSLSINSTLILLRSKTFQTFLSPRICLQQIAVNLDKTQIQFEEGPFLVKID